MDSPFGARDPIGERISDAAIVSLSTGEEEDEGGYSVVVVGSVVTILISANARRFPIDLLRRMIPVTVTFILVG